MQGALNVIMRCNGATCRTASKTAKSIPEPNHHLQVLHQPPSKRNLRINNTTRRSPNRHIITQHNKLYIQNSTLSYPSDTDRGAVIEMTVEEGLGSVWGGVEADWVGGGGGD